MSAISPELAMQEGAEAMRSFKLTIYYTGAPEGMQILISVEFTSAPYWSSVAGTSLIQSKILTNITSDAG
jgi:hypothetical protein